MHITVWEQRSNTVDYVAKLLDTSRDAFITSLTNHFLLFMFTMTNDYGREHTPDISGRPRKHR